MAKKRFNARYWDPVWEVARAQLIAKLKKELDNRLYFHGVWHTQEVVAAAEEFAREEGVTGMQLHLLRLGALYHDAGYLKQYKANEAIGVGRAVDFMVRHNEQVDKTGQGEKYSNAHLETAKGIIMATVVSFGEGPMHHARNLLEKIMCDADLSHLGLDVFWVKTDLLRRELNDMLGLKLTVEGWAKSNIGFLKHHQYFTKAAVKSRQAKKMEHLRAIEQFVSLLEEIQMARARMKAPVQEMPKEYYTDHIARLEGELTRLRRKMKLPRA